MLHTGWPGGGQLGRHAPASNNTHACACVHALTQAVTPDSLEGRRIAVAFDAAAWARISAAHVKERSATDCKVGRARACVHACVRACACACTYARAGPVRPLNSCALWGGAHACAPHMRAQVHWLNVASPNPKWEPGELASLTRLVNQMGTQDVSGGGARGVGRAAWLGGACCTSVLAASFAVPHKSHVNALLPALRCAQWGAVAVALGTGRSPAHCAQQWLKQARPGSHFKQNQ